MKWENGTFLCVAKRTKETITAQSMEFLLPTGRKNSLGFGSHEGVQISVIYLTFIETCKMCGVFTLEYLREYFNAIMQVRIDYERSSSAGLLPTGRKNMLPMTIGIKK